MATVSSWLARGRSFFTARRGRLAVGLVVAVGVALRVVVWAQARSAYQDEVALLRNLLERDYAGLFRPLAYYQYAPPLWLMSMKATVAALGPGEQALRLVPLLAGCAGLAVFGWLALRWLAPGWAVLGTATVAFSTVYLDYATAGKQYSTDLLVALGLLALADRQLRRPALTPAAALGWAGLGAALVWVSMPAVFVLAGVGLALAWHYRRTLAGPTGAWLLLLAAAWAVSFLVYFKLLLQADAQSDYLQRYHHDAMLAFPPRSADAWARLGGQLGALADKGFGKTVLAMTLAAVGALAGLVALLGRPTARTWLLLLPLLSCLAASALHYYSLLPRLMLFWLPLALLLVLTGLSDLAGRARWAAVVLPLLAVLVLGAQQRLKYFGQPLRPDFADVRAPLAYIAARQLPTDSVFAYHNPALVADYYQRLHPRPLPLRHVLLETYRYLPPHDDVLQQDLLALTRTGHHRLWVFYDTADPWLRAWAAQHGTVSEVAEFYQSYAFLWETGPQHPGQPAPPAPPAW